MPAAAVIPAPIAYIKVVAVKKLVVGFLSVSGGPPLVVSTRQATGIFLGTALHFAVWRTIQDVYFEEMRVFQASIRHEYVSME